MQNYNNSVSCPGMTTKSKLLLLYISTFITLLTFSCDGQAITTAMFEIPSKDQKLYKLKDCRKMAGDDIDCKCTYRGRECQQADVKNCRNCSCLDGSARIFYVKKRYGAVCLSRNTLYNAAGFGERIRIYSPVFKKCVQADTNIYHTNDCTFDDPRRVWLWTPGNLLMNDKTSTCLQTGKTQGDYLPMILKQCNSSDLRQKWRCEERRLLWGISFNSPNITHAVRYYDHDPVKKLNVRSTKVKVSPGNTWTVFPTTNQSVCSASHNEGSFYLSGENMDTSQIDLALPCSGGICSKKLLTSTSSNNLSNCTILWDERFSASKSEPFVAENQKDGIFFMWKSNPYTRLAGKTLDLTVECVRNHKFEEYLFRLRVKDIFFKTVPEHQKIIQTNTGENPKIPIVHLDKDCIETMCLRKTTVASTLNVSAAVCAIKWKESTLSRLDSTPVAIENITKLLSLRKDKEKFNRQWNLTEAYLLANITFNLTIFCFDDENETTTTVEESSLIFQTKHGSTPARSSEGKTSLYVASILPVIVVVLLVIAFRSWFLCRQKQRHGRTTSKKGYNERQDQNQPSVLFNTSQPSTSNQSAQRESQQYEVPCERQYEYVDNIAITLPQTFTYDYASIDATQKYDREPRVELVITEERHYVNDDYVIKKLEIEDRDTHDDYVIKKRDTEDRDTHDDYVIKKRDTEDRDTHDDYVIKKPDTEDRDTHDDYVIKKPDAEDRDTHDDYVIKKPDTEDRDTHDDYVIKRPHTEDRDAHDDYVIKKTGYRR